MTPLLDLPAHFPAHFVQLEDRCVTVGKNMGTVKPAVFVSWGLWVWVWYWELLTHWLLWCHSIAQVNMARAECTTASTTATATTYHWSVNTCRHDSHGCPCHTTHTGCIVQRGQMTFIVVWATGKSFYAHFSFFLCQLTCVFIDSFRVYVQQHNNTTQHTCCMAPNDILSFGHLFIFGSFVPLHPEPLLLPPFQSTKNHGCDTHNTQKHHPRPYTGSFT